MPFITFEGPEGAGKTTQIAHLAKRLISTGHEVIVTKEPGGTHFGATLRQLAQDADAKISPLTLTLLFFSDRAHHLDTLIRPALARGAFVVCDRFHDSTIVYQGYGQGMCLETLERFCQLVVHDAMPDLTLLLSIKPEDSMPRVLERARKDDLPLSRFEQFDEHFHERIYHGFLERAKNEPARITTIDATQSREVVENIIWEMVAARFNLPKHVPEL